MDKLQALVEKKKKAVDADAEVDTTADDTAIAAVEDSITKIEANVDSLAEFNTKEYLDLVI